MMTKYWDESGTITVRQFLSMMEAEYDSVLNYTINPNRILKARQIDLYRKEDIYFILLYICDSEGVKCPRIKLIKNRRSAYYPKKRLIKLDVYRSLNNSKNCVNLGTVIHELAHHLHCISQDKRKAYKERHHGREFTIIQDYLLKEYEDIWMKFQK